jgi:hypothetical protein
MGHPRKDKEYQLVSTKNPTKRAAAVGLLQYKADLFIISLKINLFSPWYRWKIAELALNNNHSLTITADTCIYSWYNWFLNEFDHYLFYLMRASFENDWFVVTWFTIFEVGVSMQKAK